MGDKRLVDLLLVRLNGEDEKTKVIDLLVSELGMTEEEAREKAENSPCIIGENVEMEQGRILQDRMYPFVDLLPKYQGDKLRNPPQRAHDSLDVGISEDVIPGWSVNAAEPAAESTVSGNADIETETPEKTGEEENEEDESLIITTAADEVISVSRCHICGRTPTGGEKLVPCTSCGKLTCADCYDRRNHVCERCAADGKTIDKPLDAPREEIRAPQYEVPQSPDPAPVLVRRRSPKRTYASVLGMPPGILAIIVVLVVLGVVFYLADPLGIFSGKENEVAQAPALRDAASATTEVPAGGVTGGQPGNNSQEASEPVSLALLSVPDSLKALSGEYHLPPMITRNAPRGVDIEVDSMEAIADEIGILASLNSVELDGFALVRTGSGHDILIMKITHPEPAEKRAALIGNLGTLLDPTGVDQLILYYKENQYYNPDMFSFVADSFGILGLSNSPYYLQGKQALIPETTELVTGLVFDWIIGRD